MALTDVIFGADNSSFVDRWDGITHPLEMLTEKPVAFVSPNYYGGYWLVNEAFKDSTGTDFPNGTVVHAFHGTTHALVGTGTIGAGEVSFMVSTNSPVYLVAILVSGETVRTTAVTPM